ncbi:8413_t:CDS:2 [Racocetra persica]|uniref:8413_t:CDS:1 n=1 Tax=Racocetra persica TaxID=160502 RepID=A0ACA9NYC4_9GLOM|nr:8413_t:CDS:2 [Racocetra persica]
MSDVGIEGKSNRTHGRANLPCPDCDRPRISYGWCMKCESRCMEKNFSFWTSGNSELDKLIQRSQISAVQTCDYLEFIKFEDIEISKLIGRGGFSKVYKGVWIDGPRWNWDELGDIWCRSGPIEVALKELDNSQILSYEFLEQLKKYYQCLHNGTMADCFGITRNNETGCYLFVMRYYENGNLYEFLDRNKGIISWRDMVDMLWGIASEDLRSEMPAEYHDLMTQCWDLLPENRPTASKLNETLGNWISDICDNPNPSEISNSFGDAEEKRWELIGKQNEEKKFPSNFVHEEAIYTSRIFDFSKLRQFN